MRRSSRSAAALLLSLALLGCASTKVDTTGSALSEPLCPASGAKLSALVYWDRNGGPEIRRLPGERVAEVPADSELVASASRIAADRVLVIVVRELGPVLRLGTPSLVEGGTEVVLQVRVLDVRAAKPMADVRTHWQNGGMFVIKGVGSLEQDMSAALAAVLR